ncbi:MAG: InlB B-repeat-containing protein [Clostridia bacterium]|nr:InlB B-repeat-containing protein [Clostridia bacterium]
MKTLKRILVTVLSVCLLASVATMVACKNDDNDDNTPSGYTVTFMVEGAQYGTPQIVQRGRRVTKPADPTFSVSGYVFKGWFTTSTFDEGTEWNFATGIVTENLTLYAGYRIVSEHVSEVAKANEPVTSKLVWTQAAASASTDYSVVITDASGVETTLEGSVAFDPANYKVTFTPSVIPQGGTYTVSVKDNTKTANACVVEDVIFNGAGTETNPYLVASDLDFTAINGQNVNEGTYFSLIKSISIVTNRTAQKDFVFNGIFIGNGRTITLTGNSGAIYKVGEAGVVKQVNIAGSISTSLYDSIGTIVDYNAGRVEKISVTANVESTAGTVGTSGIEKALNESLEEGRGIAGGVVGTNLATGIVYNCKITTSSSSTGTIKARIGGGTIVGYNKGTVEMCTSEGCFGAWNSQETGKSTSNYSYGGGIVGINAGSVTKCAVQGSGKLLAQRITNEESIVAGTTNSNLGGIAGYNMASGTISESYFTGLRVHGDENVGGIAGLNAGAIANCYVGGSYSSTTTIYSYVGGRTYVGGLVGKTETGATVTNCYTVANVYAYGTNGVAYAASETATNVVYLTANLNSKSKDNNNENPDPATTIAPVGAGNVAVEVVKGSADGVTTDYALAETYLATINGAEKFFFDVTIKLNFIKDIPAELTVDADLYYDDGALFDSVKIAETGASIAGPVLKGYKFLGWAIEEGGAVVFAAGAAISMYDLLDYVGTDGKVKLYAVMEVRVPNEGLIVAVYERYVDNKVEGATAAIEQAYATWMTNNGYTYSVEFRIYPGSSLGVSDFGSAVNQDGDIDVILGAGSNIGTTGKIDFLARAYMTYDGLTDRYAVLLTDTDRAIDFYSFVTGLTNSFAEITFSFGGETVTETAGLLLGTTAKAPEVSVEAGYELIGWATSATATEPEVVGTSISYEDVVALLTEGKVTLYPVIAEKQADLVVYIHLSASKTTYITDTEADAIEQAIATLYTDKVVKFVRITGVNAAGFVTAVQEAGNVDLYIGGNNADGLTFDTEYNKASAGNGHFENTSRKVGIIDGAKNKTLAITLYNYLTTAKA